MRTYILSDSERQATRVRQALARRGLDCPSDQILPLADYHRAAGPTLVVLCMAPDPDRAVIALEEVRAGADRVMAVGPGTDPRLILRAVRAGADEFVPEDELETEFDPALARLRSGATGGPGGRTYAVLGASGGCGASTVAVNTAAALARDHGGCVLIDLKLETGDLADLLDLQPQHTIADLCGGYSGPDREMFEQSLAPHGSGVRLLASPRRQASSVRSLGALGGPGVTAGSVREVLSLSRAVGPHTVVEVNPTFREEQAQALRTADAVLLVVRHDFPSVRNAKRVLDHLDVVEVDRARVRLVGSRHDLPHALPAAYAEEALGLKFFHLIPDDPKTMNAAANVGEPAVLGHPKAASAQSLRQLTAALAAAK